MEVRFAAKKAMEKHQGSALSLAIEDIIGQVNWAEEKQKQLYTVKGECQKTGGTML